MSRFIYLFFIILFYILFYVIFIYFLILLPFHTFKTKFTLTSVKADVAISYEGTGLGG